MTTNAKTVGLPLTADLDGLRVMDINDLAGYKSAIEHGRQLGFAYYFPSLLTYNRSGRSATLIANDNGSLCIFRWVAAKNGAGPRLDLLLPPAPIDLDVIRNCLERANQYNCDSSARILRIDSKDAELIGAMPGLRVTERKSQYLYSPESFADISGRKYRTLRRNMSKVTALEHVEVFPYMPSHAEACLTLLKKWRRNHRERHGTLGGVGTTKRIIDLAGKITSPDIRGEVIMIDSKLVAFAFGGEIRPGVGAFIEAKSDFEIQGLTYFQRHSFMSKLNGLELINDGSDAGREGLRQIKNSLRPTGMHQEYRGYQRSR